MLAATIVAGAVEVRDHPDPRPGLGQVRVRVRAAGLNAADLIQIRGGYPPPPGIPADIPGLELAGEVDGLGPGVTRFSIGDRIMAVVGGAAQAELAVVHEREAMAVPPGLDWAAAGGLPEAFTTAHDALFTQAGLRPGERVLVHGAAGGVGVAAVQLAVLAGASVTATVRAPGRREAVGRLGATVLAPEDAFGAGPYDVVVELVGGANMAANLASLALKGRICVIGVGAGAHAEIDLHALMRARGRIHGSTLRSRPLEEKAAAARLVEAQVLPHVAAGRIAVPVQDSFALGEAARAYEAFEAGGKLGKLVLVAGD